MTMKLQLDGDAVERLIGGNTEVEIELRKWVVQEFTKKYLKAVVSDKEFTKFLNEERGQTSRVVSELIKKHVGETVYDGYSSNFKMVSSLETALKTELDNMLKGIIFNVVASTKRDVELKVNEVFVQNMPSIDGIIKLHVNKLTKEYITEKVKARLAEVTSQL
jgi:hypothetical protein